MHSVTNEDVERVIADKDIMNILNRLVNTSGILKILSYDEVYSIILVKIFQCLKNFRADGGSKYSTYLYWSVRNEFLEEFRNAAKRNGFTSGSLEMNEPSYTIDRYEEDEPDNIESHVWDSLDKDSYDILCSRFVEERTYKEIAAEKNMNIQKASWITRKAIIKCREIGV